ncbi:hypothetical protein [Actinoplanes friuliensis]|jgi:hypothetical protein|uniref:HEAT repeat domain-containing protein n=1 Tax=Actinoplanes friuliensis DSM 7358 TaxID=1246995 RepID=U5W6A3_9ACTN|nr:hypothetical protein [Actinoplanes friuliensis]AGZ43525.1 hypothetical protein AFR_26315 [Actinoplanes friuliensis DSM 7358]
MAREFERWLRLLHSRDPGTSDDGYFAISRHARELVDDLLAEYDRERGPARLSLLMLLGDARSPKAFDVLAAELTSEDETMRRWARHGLEALDTKEARTLLWRDRQNNPPG